MKKINPLLLMLTFLSLSFDLVAQTERDNKHKDNQHLLSYQYKDSLFKTFALFDSALMKTTKIYNQYYERGRRLMTFKDSAKKALEMFDSALVFNPNSAEAYYRRGKIKIDFGLFKDGLNDYDAAIKVADIKIKLIYFQRKEQIFYLNKKIDSFVSITDKLSTYNDAIAMFPDTFRVYFDRSQFYHRIKDYKKAIADARKVITYNTNVIDFYYQLAELMEESKAYNDIAILQVYNDAIKNDPNSNKGWVSYENRASYYEKKANGLDSKLTDDSLETDNKRRMYYQMALRDYDTAKARAIRYKLGDWSLLLNARIKCMASSHLFSQQVIIDEYTNNINDRYDWLGYEHRASYFAKIKQYKEAIADLDTCISLDSGFYSTYLDRAKYKIASGVYNKMDILADLARAKDLLYKIDFGRYAIQQFWQEYDKIYKVYNDSTEIKK